MPRRAPKTQRDYGHTWYLREWMEQADPPLIQADMIHDLGFSRAKASDVYNGQRYTQELIDVLAPWLNAKPFELLLPPSEAARLRSLDRALRAVARDFAVSQADEAEAPAETPSRRQA